MEKKNKAMSSIAFSGHIVLEDLSSLEEQVSAFHEFPLFQQQSNVIPIKS